jgi:type I restriction enzyme M protein
MLNSDTKRHIDAARDVLVGVAPNPTTQIDQITYALIYKFMDDMDQSAIKAGGNPSFFTGDLEPYAWSRFMDSRMGNQEKMNLYGEALTKFSEAKQLPELFRTIFRAAFLPYRSPETLGLFLKEISYFDYSHPEELGNAYEYLLSIMSSQGDAGQFRTPRHIIDFIVDVLNPTKDDKVLDPACGTAGFLVSTYNHILGQHDGKDDPKKKEKTLTPDERKKLMQNLQGYDIDPTMVRIAQVNMYLHQFKNPQIFQYDSLTSEERWSDTFDVILANPPFMSPKGGIKPHNKFSVPSNRAEVLFVDYIINHLRPKGRAGIIVPEGIIFQSGNAYKALRKNLVENGLYAVVSLPSGVFNPYAGVKTSILLIHNELAKQKNEIAFVKISADGYDLGASKRKVSQNDLPLAFESLRAWANGKNVENAIFTLVSKKEIAENGDYNLSKNRYTPNPEFTSSSWPIESIGNISSLYTGGTPTSSNSDYYGGDIKWLVSGDIHKGQIFDCDGRITEMALKESNAKLLPINSVMIALNGQGKTRGTVAILRTVATCNQSLVAISPDITKCKPEYLYYVLKSMYQEIRNINGEDQRGGLNMPLIRQIEIPLPPLEVQEQIVAELDGYAAIISGAKQIVENWKPRIDVDSAWDVYPLGDLVDVLDSKRKPITKSDRISGPYPYYGATGILDYVEDYLFDERLVLLGEDGAKWESGQNSAFIVEGKYWVNNHAHVLRPIKEKLNDIYLVTLLNQMDLMPLITGVTVPKLNQERMRAIEIPLPRLEIQQELAKKIEIERNQVEAASKLIEAYEARTQMVIAKLWSE